MFHACSTLQHVARQYDTPPIYHATSNHAHHWHPPRRLSASEWQTHKAQHEGRGLCVNTWVGCKSRVEEHEEGKGWGGGGGGIFVKQTDMRKRLAKNKPPLPPPRGCISRGERKTLLRLLLYQAAQRISRGGTCGRNGSAWQLTGSSSKPSGTYMSRRIIVRV